ncbi:MAG TPA: hypothetical protein VH933_05525 [Aestuariivirgaceae bacterium]|jgi:hypothetical protein
MRTGIDVCGPDQLKILQQIFDCVWLEMLKEGNVDTTDEILRNSVSRRVMDHAHGDIWDVEGIKRAVLKSLKTAG